MNDTEAREIVTAALLTIVPDAELETLDEDTDLREALELDSLDFLAFVEHLSGCCGQRIDEDDYPHLRTLSGCTKFLNQHANA